MESNQSASENSQEKASGNHSLQGTVEQLLYEDEGNALDFKVQQYPFASASDEQKGELVKDILAMVNSWSRADTRYILVGVKEVTVGRAEVRGVTEHLSEHTLQQLVNSKLNRPIELSYHAVEIEGASVGVIVIPRQRRPAFTRKAIGKLQRNTVYLRRGSSTSIADPDEIYQMGVSASGKTVNRNAKIEVRLCNPDTRELYGNNILFEASPTRVLDPGNIPNYDPPRSVFDSTMLSNREYYRDFARYLCALECTLPLGFHVQNVGDGAAANVTLRMEVIQDAGYTVLDEPVEEPDTSGLMNMIAVDQTEKLGRPYRPKLRGDAVLEIRYDLGTVQPGFPVWTDPFYLIVERVGKLALSVGVFSDQLPTPKQVLFSIEAKGEEYEVEADAIVQLANGEFG